MVLGVDDFPPETWRFDRIEAQRMKSPWIRLMKRTCFLRSSETRTTRKIRIMGFMQFQVTQRVHEICKFRRL